MHLILSIIYILCFTSNIIEGLNSKLDFGDNLESSAIRSPQRTVFKKIDDVKVISKETGNLKDQELICTSSGCNKTTSEDDSDIVKTNVIVQVKTSVDAKNKTKKVEDIPDVSVVLGTNGAGSGNIGTPGLHFQPISRTYPSNSGPLEVTNIENAFPYLTSNLVPANLYKTQKSYEIDSNHRTPTVFVPMPDGYQYRDNGVELKVPYFDPTYHNHYYGENSPPQVAFYPRANTVHNPVAFNNFPRPTYSVSAWKKIPVMSQVRRHDANCMCQNENSSGLRWYPSTGGQVNGNRPSRHSGDAGTQINNKLAPLN